jgi:hypothetical protein
VRVAEFGVVERPELRPVVDNRRSAWEIFAENKGDMLRQWRFESVTDFER